MSGGQYPDAWDFIRGAIAPLIRLKCSMGVGSAKAPYEGLTGDTVPIRLCTHGLWRIDSAVSGPVIVHESIQPDGEYGM